VVAGALAVLLGGKPGVGAHRPTGVAAAPGNRIFLSAAAVRRHVVRA
jgi:hypothetical protein